MQAWRQLAVAHLQQHLRHARDAGRAFAMADVRLGRADGAELGVCGRLPERLVQARDFDRVAERGAGAVRLDVTDRARVDPRFFQRARNNARLRIRVGHGVAVGLAAMVDGRALDDPVDMVAVGDCPRLRLEQQHAHAFARYIAVAALAKALAVAFAGGELALSEHQVFVRVDRDVDAAGKSQLAASALQTVASQVDCRQRRRAHGVERHARPLEIAVVRNAVGDRRRAARQRYCPALCLLLRAVQLVFLVHGTGEHAHAGRAERLLGVARIFQRTINALQEQALLRVDDLRIPWRDIEEQRVELVHAFDEAAPFAAGGAGLVLVGVEVKLVIPAIRRDLGDAILAVLEVLPKRLDVDRLRIAPGDADDGHFHRFMRHGLRLWAGRKTATRTGAQSRRRFLHAGCRWRGLRHARLHAQQSVKLFAMRFDKIAADLLDRPIFEEQGFRQGAEHAFQLARQLDHHDRIDAILVQRGIGFQLVRRLFQLGR